MNNQEILTCVDEMVEKWGDILVPIYTEKEFHNDSIFLLGTGFLVSFEGVIYLVTALHVLDEQEGKTLIIRIGDKGAVLSKMEFLVSREHDIAISKLNKSWADEHGIGKVKAIPIDDKKADYSPLGRYFLIGFPGKKNILHLRHGNRNWNIQGTSFIRKIDKPQSKSHVDDPIAFEFDKKNAIYTDGKKANPPNFNGNSGGPILELVVKNDSLNHEIIGCKLSGIFTGWHKVEKEAVAVKPDYLIGLILHMD